MKFQIKLEDTEERFQIHIYTLGTNNCVYTCGWRGGEFKYLNKQYAVYGPYHSLDVDQFRVYELIPVSEVA